MNTIIKLILISALVILIGTFLMYSIEHNQPNSEIKSLEDALWWCIATVSTVGYGDIVPVTNIGRMIAILYMGFGISILAILLSTITNNFYKNKIEIIERKKEKDELYLFRKEVMDKLADIERKQTEYLELYIKQYKKSNDKS